MKKIVTGAVGFLLFAAGPVFAVTSVGQPQVKTYAGIPYLSGGFGVDERENLQAMSKADNLELSFALQKGNYLDGAQVLIEDAKGKRVLDAVSDGPLFFAKLPEGTYTVQATAMGKTLKQTAHVPSKGRAQVYFAWKESNEQAQTNTLAKR